MPLLRRVGGGSRSEHRAMAMDFSEEELIFSRFSVVDSIDNRDVRVAGQSLPQCFGLYRRSTAQKHPQGRRHASSSWPTPPTSSAGSA